MLQWRDARRGMPRGTPEEGSRMTIGVVFDSLIGIYQDPVWRGVSDAASELDIRLRIYVGGALEYAPLNPFEKTKNIAYDLIDIRALDGLILCG